MLESDDDPEFYTSLRKDDRRRNLDTERVGSTPVETRLGVMFVEDSALGSKLGKNFETPTPFSAILWVYVYEVDQESCIFGKIEEDDEQATF